MKLDRREIETWISKIKTPQKEAIDPYFTHVENQAITLLIYMHLNNCDLRGIKTEEDIKNVIAMSTSEEVVHMHLMYQGFVQQPLRIRQHIGKGLKCYIEDILNSLKES